jgi:hypothetical protein
MTCQLLASKHALASPQTINALLVLMTALADARYHAKSANFLNFSLYCFPCSPPIFPYRRMFLISGVQQSLFE